MSDGEGASAHPARSRRTTTELDQEVTFLYRAQRSKLRGFLSSLGCAESCLDDVCQDAFLAVRLRMDKTNIESLEAYLYRVATNRFHRLSGKPDEQFRPCDELVVERLAARSEWENIDRRQVLRMVFECLSPRQRQVIFLRFDVDLSVRQTAEVLGIAEGTVKKSTSEAKDRLREFLRADPDSCEGER